MKKLLFTLVTLLGTFSIYSQSSLIATLSHNGEISVFYGANALRDAHTSATDGDVITLSSGSFLATDITKAITLRGAGMNVNEEANRLLTIISGSFTISIADTINQFICEGIYHNNTITLEKDLLDASFLKCRFNKILAAKSNGYYKFKNASFIHCKILKSLNAPTSTITCINSFIYDPYVYDSSTPGHIEYVNCVIYSSSSNNNLSNSSLHNSIICSYNQISANSNAYNCVGYYTRTSTTLIDIFANIPNITNTTISSSENIFKTYELNATISDSETFELTESAINKYKGLDGTQVGMFGGNLPFDDTPTNPQIVKCNVASKSTADGKLSVDIEVKAAE